MANEPNTSTDTKAGLLDRVMDRMQRVVLITMVLLVGIGTLVLMVLGSGLYLWGRENDAVVKAVQDAGRVHCVTLTPGLLNRSLVETDTGFYALREGASLSKGEPLTLETRANFWRYLCDAQHRCIALL